MLVKSDGVIFYLSIANILGLLINKVFSLSMLTQSQVSIKFSSPRLLPNLRNRIFIRFVHLLSYNNGF